MFSTADEIWRDFRDQFFAGLRTPTGSLPPGTVVEHDRQLVGFITGAPVEPVGGYPESFWTRFGKSKNVPLEFSWHETLANECASISGRVRDLGSKEKIRIGRLVSTDGPLILDALRSLGVDVLTDVILSCSDLVLWYRLRGAEVSPFGEILDKIMVAGGLPFGFEGDDPKGSILVYWPHPGRPAGAVSG